MVREPRDFRDGPSLFEYTVIIALIIFVVVLVILITGQTGSNFSKIEIGL
jgi:hypothetical protein